MEIIYGTGNEAKIASMRRTLKGLPFTITGPGQAAAQRGIRVPEVEETGATPLENARQKAQGYYRLFHSPVFSCDSGLYLWNHATGEPLLEQPGVQVRGRQKERYSDQELLDRYVGLVRKYGPVRARYQNAVCLIWDEQIRGESMEEDLWGEPFLLTDVPHPTRRVEGFPLDGISLEIESGKYFYDLEEDSQDTLAAEKGFARFFREFADRMGFAR